MIQSLSALPSFYIPPAIRPSSPASDSRGSRSSPAQPAPTACADTFDFFEREQPVGGRALVSDAKLLFAMFKKLFATAQHAGNIGADLDVEFAARLGRQHGVIADYVADLEFGQVQAAGNLCDDLIGEISDLVLPIQERRN